MGLHGTVLPSDIPAVTRVCLQGRPVPTGTGQQRAPALKVLVRGILVESDGVQDDAAACHG